MIEKARIIVIISIVLTSGMQQGWSCVWEILSWFMLGIMLGMMWCAINTNITASARIRNLFKVLVDLKRISDAMKNGKRIKR